MQQPCVNCGYISDRPARFCRQCGSQLYAESESSSAETRNYGRQTPPRYAEPQQSHPHNAPGQAYTPGQAFDDQTPSTSPFYNPPAVPQYQYPVVEQKKFNWGKWILISMLTFLMVVMVGIGGFVYLGKKWVESNVGISSGSGEAVTPPDAPEAPDAPPPPGAPVGSDRVGKLEDYKYPNAKVVEQHIDPIAQTISLTTDDDLEKVKEYYDQKFKQAFKNSATNISNQNDNHYIYTSLSNPMLTIEIQPDEADDSIVHIKIARIEVKIPEIKIPEIKIGRN